VLSTTEVKEGDLPEAECIVGAAERQTMWIDRQGPSD
jgi:hypothetical protein